jgi:hypothetical protein
LKRLSPGYGGNRQATSVRGWLHQKGREKGRACQLAHHDAGSWSWVPHNDR